MSAVHKDARPIITLKLSPEFGNALRSEYKDIIPGYYMNKDWWNSVYLDGAVFDELLKEMVDQSHQLVFAALSKKRQKELSEK